MTKAQEHLEKVVADTLQRAPLGEYAHWKKGRDDIAVLGVSFLESNCKPYIRYRHHGIDWLRTPDEFLEQVENLDGVLVPRFARVFPGSVVMVTSSTAAKPKKVKFNVSGSVPVSFGKNERGHHVAIFNGQSFTHKDKSKLAAKVTKAVTKAAKQNVASFSAAVGSSSCNSGDGACHN